MGYNLAKGFWRHGLIKFVEKNLSGILRAAFTGHIGMLV
jgi:hypothetical protein